MLPVIFFRTSQKLIGFFALSVITVYMSVVPLIAFYFILIDSHPRSELTGSFNLHLFQTLYSCIITSAFTPYLASDGIILYQGPFTVASLSATVHVKQEIIKIKNCENNQSSILLFMTHTLMK